jgi:hypothetical protein
MDEDRALEEDAVAWELPTRDATSGPSSLADIDGAAVTAEDTSGPTLPDALFDHRDDVTEATVYWYVHEDLSVAVMSNTVIEDAAYRELARTPLERTDEGYTWEIPAALITGRQSERGQAYVPEAARFQSGSSIHFRASSSMLDGDHRTCYVLTADRLSQLTESR